MRVTERDELILREIDRRKACGSFFIKKDNLSLPDITTEKQLHQLDGFGTRKHRPDFIFTKNLELLDEPVK